MKAPDAEAWKGRKVTVAGLGAFGGQVAVTRFFAGLGAEVTVTDKKSAESLSASLRQLEGLDVRLVLGGHDVDDFTGADLVVASPAIPETSEFLQAAEAAGVEITHEMDLFFLLCRACIIGVTGSNGKSTTAALLAHILTACVAAGAPAARRVWLGGNIGRSLLGDVAEITPDDLVVLELSSFQLEDLGALEISPYGAIVTNLSPNHLDRHETFENYAKAKRNITLFQGEEDFLILNADDPNLAGWEETRAPVAFFGKDAGDARKGVFISGGDFVFNAEGARSTAHTPSGWRLRGEHNLLNLAAAVSAAWTAGANPETALAAAADFKPLAHRLEFIGSVRGVGFYNDSIATTPESALAALESFTEPIVLVAGGYDKGVDLSPFARAAARRAKAIVAIGRTGGRIAKEARAERPNLEVMLPETFAQAVEAAFASADEGDVVLLSPACASYDMFENFQQRGETFKREVERLGQTDTGGKTG